MSRGNPAAEAVACVNHADVAARWVCRQCGRAYCDGCITVVQRGRERVYVCPACRDQCGPLTLEPDTRMKFFLRKLLHAAVWPFVGRGKWLLIFVPIALAVLAGIGSLAKGMSIAFGPLGIIPSSVLHMLQFVLYLALVGFVLGWLLDVIGVSARGDDEPPDWPTPSRYSGLVSPLLLVLGGVGIAFLPATAYYIAANVWYGSHSSWIFSCLLAVGVFVSPMAILAAALHESLAGLNPVLLLRSIVRAGWAYVAAMVAMALVAAAAVGWWVLSDVMIPFVGEMLAGAVLMYFLAVEMRILGLLYWVREDRLGWFEEPCR